MSPVITKKRQYTVSGIVVGKPTERYFDNYRAAAHCAAAMSQASKAYIHISFVGSDKLLPYWYTVTKGKVEKHQIERVKETHNATN